MMVTRHTIDQILSYGHTRSSPPAGPHNTRSSPPAGPHNTRSSPPAGPHNTRSSPPAGPHNTGSSPPAGPHNTRSSPPAGPHNTRSSPPAGPHNTRSSPPAGPHNTRSSPPAGPHNTGSSPPAGPHNTRSSPVHGPPVAVGSCLLRTPPATADGPLGRDSNPVSGASDILEDSKPGIPKTVAGSQEPPSGEKTCEGPGERGSTANTQEDLGRPPLARPVALRPMATQDTPLLDASPAGHRVGLRPEAAYSGVCYGGLEAGAGVYGLMLRQYMEAHCRTLATSRAILPLPYPLLDPGMGYQMAGRCRRRGGQVRFTSDQSRRLEACFTSHKYITPPQRKVLARELDLQERQVKTWFQNRRAKWRKVQAQKREGEPPEAGSSPATSHEGSEDDRMDDQHIQEGLNTDDQHDDSHLGGSSTGRTTRGKNMNRKGFPVDQTTNAPAKHQ